MPSVRFSPNLSMPPGIDHSPLEGAVPRRTSSTQLPRITTPPTTIKGCLGYARFIPDAGRPSRDSHQPVSVSIPWRHTPGVLYPITISEPRYRIVSYSGACIPLDFGEARHLKQPLPLESDCGGEYMAKRSF